MNRLKGLTGDIYAATFCCGELVCGGHDKVVYVWQSSAVRLRLKGHQHSIKALSSMEGAGSDEGDSLLVSGSWDMTLRVWSFKTGTCLRVLSGHENRVRCLSWCAPNNDDGDDQQLLLFSGGDDCSLRVWSPLQSDHAMAQSGTLHSGGILTITALRVSSLHTTWLFSGGVDKVIRATRLTKAPSGGGWCLAPDSTVLRGHTARISSIQSWQEPRTGPRSSESLLVLSASSDMTLRLWERLVYSSVDALHDSDGGNHHDGDRRFPDPNRDAPRMPGTENPEDTDVEGRRGAAAYWSCLRVFQWNASISCIALLPAGHPSYRGAIFYAWIVTMEGHASLCPLWGGQTDVGRGTGGSRIDQQQGLLTTIKLSEHPLHACAIWRGPENDNVITYSLALVGANAFVAVESQVEPPPPLYGHTAIRPHVLDRGYNGPVRVPGRFRYTITARFWTSKDQLLVADHHRLFLLPPFHRCRLRSKLLHSNGRQNPRPLLRWMAAERAFLGRWNHSAQNPRREERCWRRYHSELPPQRTLRA